MDRSNDMHRNRRAAPRRCGLPRLAALGVTLALAGWLSGCAGLGGPPRSAQVDPVHVSDLLGTGDAQRRASTRLVAQGLEADEHGQTGRAQGSYERAIQVDATNPWAYLALARHYLDSEAPERALPLLDQAAALFESAGEEQPGVQVHMMGLRGRALQAIGRGEDGRLYLEHANELAPGVWGDGHLSAAELL